MARKMMLLLVAVLLLGASPVFAANATATFGDQNSSGVYRVVADTDGVVTFASDTGIKYPYEHVTSVATETLTAAQTGITITDYGVRYPNGSAACSKHVLPRAVAGLQYTLVTGSKCFTDFDTVDTSDTILYSIAGTDLDAGDSVKSTGQIGDSITVMSTSAGTWVIKSMKGTWTDNGSS